MIIDKEYEVTIIDNDINGNGIAKKDGLVIFIPYALKDEIVKIKITSYQKNYATGEIISFLKQSSKRTNIICPYYFSCGGCNFLHTLYEEENRIKEETIKQTFSSYKVNNLVAVNEYNYRNKVSFHINEGKLGFYKKNSHEFVKISNCLLLNKNINDIIKEIEKLDLSKITNIVIKGEEEILLSFYGTIDSLSLLSLKNKNIKSIYLNDINIKGDSFIKIKVNNYSFLMTPLAFFQVNKDCMIKLYDKIKEYASFGYNLLDLYCGTGTIGIYLSNNFKEICGIEIVKEAICNANINKKNNHINNINFTNDDASNISKKTYDCIIVDPPRKGLTKKLINKLKELNSKRIVYVSCNYKTLKKDLALLEDTYQVIEITPFNMFPKTAHVECVCLLTEKITKSNLTIKG